MADRNREPHRQDRFRPADLGQPYEGRERRSFGEEGRFSSDQARYYGADTRDYRPRADPAAGDRSPWRRDRYGGRLSEDRGLYGSGADPRGGYGPDEDHAYHSYDGDYHGGQEYGLAAGDRERRYNQRLVRQSYGDNRGDDLGYESRRPQDRGGDRGDRSGPYGHQPLPHDEGSREFGPPHDYAYHPDAHDLEPDYVAWRDEQLRNHDRDYAGWRAEQHRRYDEDYRSFRSERRTHFGKTFTDWRAQREAVAKELSQKDGVTNGDAPEDKV